MIKYQVGDMVYFRGSECEILHVLSKGNCLIISLGFGLQTSVATGEVKPIFKIRSCNMKTVEELRAKFEETEMFKGYDNFVIYVPSVNDYRSDRYSDYSMGFLSGAWFMFQELNK